MEILLSAERIKLELVTLHDLDDIHELHSLPETDKFNTLGIPNNKQETSNILDQWIKESLLVLNPKYTFAIRNAETGDFIGLMALNCGKLKFQTGEVWYKLHVDYWGKGYATEALFRVLDFGFNQLNLHRIEAGCAVENIGSIKLLERVGMIREGRKRKVLPLKSGWSDNYIYAILDEDWYSKN